MSTVATHTATAPAPAQAAQQAGPQEKIGYLFGQKIAASLSPLFHNTIYANLGLKWQQERLDSSDVPAFLERIKSDPAFYGAAVTMPNKVSIMPHLDVLTDECRDVGACNTIFLRKDPQSGKQLFCGTNTDVVGIRESFYRNVQDRQVFEGRPGMVIGGGGAARSAVYALHKWMGATDIYLVNRDKSEVDAVMAECKARGYGDRLVHVSSVEQAQSAQSPGAIVACVPDFPPRTDEEKLARAITQTILDKESKGAVLEMCYNPNPYTELGALAEKSGWQVILGTEAMIYQGLEQDKYWTGLTLEELPVKEVGEVIAAHLAKVARS